MKQPLAAIVLCGGASRRMGQDKASLRFCEGARVWTLQGWMAQRWQGHCRPMVWVGYRGQESSSPEHLYVQDCADFAGQGPIAGLYSGLKALESASRWALLLAVDMPDYAPAWASELLAQAQLEDRALGFDAGDKSSLFGALLDVDTALVCAHKLLEQGERRLWALRDALAMRRVPLPLCADPRAFRSGLNAPDDFAQWLEREGFVPEPSRA